MLGAELTHRLLLPACGPHRGLGVVALVYALVASVLAVRRAQRRWGTVAAPFAACAVVSFLTFATLPALPSLNPHLGFTVIEQLFDADGALAIVAHERTGRAMMVNNQYVLGSSAAQYDQERQAHIPLLLHARPARVAFIGMATGSTPGAALAHRSVESIEVLEIAPRVVEAAGKYFGDLNHGLLSDPRARVLVEDGRTWIAAARGRYDVLVGDLFLPWSSGAGRLYSLEHFRAVHAALRGGGLFCQWLPMYQLSRAQFEVIVSTLLRVFPEVHLFRNGLHPDRPAAALIAFKDARLDWRVPPRRAEALRASDMVEDPSVRHAEALSMLYLGRYARDGDGQDASRLNTLENVWLELDAGRERLTGRPKQKYLLDQRWNDFVKERVQRQRDDHGIPKEVRALSDLGFLATNWEIARRTKHPAEAKLRALLSSRFPISLTKDERARWAAWPGLRGW